MKRLFLFLLAILTLYCIAQVFAQDNTYGMFLAVLAVALTLKTIHLSADRDAYREHFREGKRIIQSYRDEYEPE